jgi:Lon protease-like protein
MSDADSSTNNPILRVPLFPLPTVLVPGLVMPLVLFEPKYLKLAEHLVNRDESDRYFGVVKTTPKMIGATDFSMNMIGTMAQVQSLELRPDNKWDVVTAGARKFQILEIHQDMPYLTADIQILPEEGELEIADDELISTTISIFDQYRRILGVSVTENSDLPRDGQTLSYLITAVAMFSLDEKQALLETHSTRVRLCNINKILKREISLLSKIVCFPTFEPSTTISFN